MVTKVVVVSVRVTVSERHACCSHWSRSHARASHHTWRGTTHSHAHHWVLLLSKHQKLHLLGLHMICNLLVFIDFMLEKGSLELLFSELMVHKNPIVSDGANQNWHHHWVLSNLIRVFFLELIKGKVI